MGHSIYYFADFCLNPVARELSQNGEPVALAASAFDCLVYLVEHRERPVGRDELISAVWGRADVSDNLLAQTIVRLRRVLGDAGTEQRCIKTVARVGYRWMLDVTVECQDVAARQEPEQGRDIARAARDEVHAIGRRVTPRRRFALVAALLVLALAGGYASWRVFHASHAPAVARINQGTAVVLPVTVDASEDWKWLRLGLMDLISTQLRQAKVPTENSQDVLNLLKQASTSVDDALAPFALVIRPHVTQVDNIWRVHLDAKTRDGHTWQAESSSSDVLDATRAASNILLAQLGFGGGPGRHSGSNVQQEYLLRIEAAQIAGQPDLASELIDKAPPELQHTPALMFAQAELYCQQGKLDPCAQTLHDLLKQLPANEQPVLRAKALTALWFTSKRENHFAEGEAALTEAINILRAQHDAEALATAYLDRSHLYFYQGKVDEATADLGSARVNYALAGDTVGQAKVDYGMGMIAMRRRQFGAALPLMQHAYEQFQRMGVRQLVAVALSGVANAQKMMLQFPDELATTDRYWPLDQKHLDFLDPYTRHQLGLIRAGALADNGRTVDAGTLFERILAESNVENEADLRAMASTSLAQLALERGDTQGALAWINKAMAGTGLQQDDDPLDYADAWLIKVAVLQRTGDIGELKHTVDAMQTWAAHLPMRNDGVDIRIMQAQAAQAWSEGKHDEALERLKSAMAAANTLGVPELIVGVAKPYALALLASGHLDQAIAVSGQLSTWANQDWRAAWVEACVYRALGQTAAWEKARSKAQQLAGDRPLPVAGVVEFF